jgi:hypothetical protein
MATHASLHRAPNPLEAAARASVDALLERTITDAEWVRIRSRLLELVNILRTWDRTPRRNETDETIRFPKAA